MRETIKTIVRARKITKIPKPLSTTNDKTKQPRMVRSVNNFLTAEERQQISDFINCKKKESSTHVREDNRIIDKEQKKRRTKKIEELRQKKYKQWKARVDNISSDKTQTWHTKIENGEVERPINEFLILFKKIIENPLLLGEERELLKKLEHALCG